VTDDSNVDRRASSKGALCAACGYDLRGIESPLCPECGAPRVWRRLRFLSLPEFLQAVEVLQNANRFQLRIIDPRFGNMDLLTMLPTNNAFGEIQVSQSDSADAIQVLEDAGIFMPLPIVDRAEPNCPACLHPLDETSDKVCPSCGAGFQWVTIEEPEIDLTGMLCRHCGYELTGNVSEQCPECGEEIVHDLETFANAAVGAQVVRRDAEPQTMDFGVKLLAYLVISGAISLCWGLIANVDADILAWTGGVAATLLSVAGVIVIIRRA
jgi:predicted RNA-binding Zn-ribbon protein involved in translation (DUF1610 family)